MLFGFPFLGYLLRMNISVAQQNMAPELGLNNVQVGQIFTAFMLGYALFQLPSGIWGDRFGPRRVLVLAAISWSITTFACGFVPGRFLQGTIAAFMSLLVLRFLLGVGEAAIYPVAGRAICNWIPVQERAFAQAITMMGSTVGAAFAPPLVANIMHTFGWRTTFYLTSVLPVGMAGLWWYEARDHPEEHKGVGGDELSYIASGRQDSVSDAATSWRVMLRNRDIVFLCVSYFLDSYVLFIFVFWLFKYLIDVRHFSIVGGGWAGAVPFVAGTIALPSAGYLSDRLSARVGILKGRRTVAVSCLFASSILLCVGAGTSQLWLAMLGISLSVAFLFSTEGPYWATIIDLGGKTAGAAGGLMNMAGNLGGVVSTAAIPMLVHWLGWFGALLSGSMLAVLSAAFWFFLRPRSSVGRTSSSK